MKILILGSGGREHALAWKAAQSPKVTQIFVAPGNGGTALDSKLTNVKLDIDNHAELIKFARQEKIELTIVGPEIPLVAGVVDAFTAANLKCFGPTQAAAQLEGSKAYCKDFLKKYQIPTAAYATFTEIAPALDYLKISSFPIVIKADGLAAGKGVVIAQTEEDAVTTVKDMLESKQFGEAGAQIVIEEFLQGEEASFICMLDGKNILPLASSQDHKARDNGDLGPNTGGMGAYSPAPVVTPLIHEKVIEEIIKPTLAGIQSEGANYTGFLYAGLMIDAEGNSKVLEFNCRFGDPETQPIMMRLRSDLVELCLAAMEGKLDQVDIDWDERAAVGVVIASDGYPNQYDKGLPIRGLDSDVITSAKDIKVFHAGTQLKVNEDNANNAKKEILTNGGRVLCVTALGATVLDAQKKAYIAANTIKWPGSFCRTDIGYRAINRDTQSKT